MRNIDGSPLSTNACSCNHALCPLVPSQAFDGTIRVEVKGKEMKLTIHNGGKDATSNVRKSSARPCNGVNMMTLQLELTKLGFAQPGLTNTLGKDGLHLQEWLGPPEIADSWAAMATRNTVPNNKYAVKVRIAVEATAKLGADGKWTTSNHDIKKCSPGIEFAGALAKSTIFTKLKSWGVVDYFANIGGMLTDPLYCTLKYTIPNTPWLGHITSFVANADDKKSLMRYDYGQRQYLQVRRLKGSLGFHAGLTASVVCARACGQLLPMSTVSFCSSCTAETYKVYTVNAYTNAC